MREKTNQTVCSITQSTRGPPTYVRAHKRYTVCLPWGCFTLRASQWGRKAKFMRNVPPFRAIQSCFCTCKVLISGLCFRRRGWLESAYKNLSRGKGAQGCSINLSQSWARSVLAYSTILPSKIKPTPPRTGRHIKTMPVCHQRMYAIGKKKTKGQSSQGLSPSFGSF